MSTLIQYLRRPFLLSGKVDLSDGQLLDCFLVQGEDAALGALVKRHGPMVWGVCRRVLGDFHDAEDAFQATFLVFIRKASSIFPRDNVANWLYGVALKTAKKAKSVSIRRKSREKQVKEIPDVGAREHATWHDIEPVLDQELSRLPKKYRSALILFELEGKSRRQVACELGLSEGTVAGYLTRARALLASRLSRYGFTLSCIELAQVLAENAACAAVPRSVLLTTAKNTTMIATGKAAVEALVSTSVAGLAKGVLKVMLFSKLKTAAGGVLLTGICCGAGALTHQAWATNQAALAECSVPSAQRERGGRVENSPAPVSHSHVSHSQNQAASGPQLQIELKDVVLSAIWSRDGKWLVSGTKAGTIHIIEFATGKEIRSFSTGEAAPALAISPDGKTLAVASAGLDAVSYWETGNGERAAHMPKKSLGNFQPDNFAFSPNGQLLVHIRVDGFFAFGAVGAEGKGAAWGQAGKAGAGGGAGENAAWGKAGAGGGAGGNAAWGKAGAGGEAWEKAAWGKVGGAGGAAGRPAPADVAKGVAAIAPDGSTCGSSDTKGKFNMIVDAKSKIHKPGFTVGNVSGLAFIPNRNHVAVATDEGRVHIWDWTLNKKVATLTGATKPASRLVCSMDGNTLAAVADDKSSVLIWDLTRNNVRGKISHKSGSIQAVAMSPDGKMIAFATADGKTLYVQKARSKE